MLYRLLECKEFHCKELFVVSSNNNNNNDNNNRNLKLKEQN